MIGKNKLYVVNPRNVLAEDSQLAGDKAVELARISNQGLPIPDSFIVTSAAFDDFVTAGGLIAPIAEALRDVTTQEEAEQAYAKISGLISQTNFPNTILQPVTQAYQSLCGNVDRYVELSASPVNLDEAEQRILATLPVQTIRGDAALLYQLKLVWANLFAPELLLYRHQHGIRTGLSTAVMVTKAISAEISGRAYACDPASGDDRYIVIEALLGLPPSSEAMWNEQADIYRIDKTDSKILEKMIISQETMTIRRGRNDSADSTTWEVKISPEWKRRQKLDEQGITQLAKIIQQLAEHEPNVEISWAYELGKVFITAITTYEASALDNAFLDHGHVVSEIELAEPKRGAERVNIGLLASEVEEMATQLSEKGQLESPNTLSIYTDISSLDSDKLRAAQGYSGVYFDLGVELAKHTAELKDVNAPKVVELLSGAIDIIVRTAERGKLILNFSDLEHSGVAGHLQHSDLLQQEIQAIKRAVSAQTDMILSIPRAKTALEIVNFKKFLSTYGLTRSGSCQMFAELATPTLIYGLRMLEQDTIDGLLVNLDKLIGSMFGEEGYDADTLYSTIEDILVQANRLAIPAIFKLPADFSVDYDRLAALGGGSIEGFIFTGDLTPHILQELRRLENARLLGIRKVGRPTKELYLGN